MGGGRWSSSDWDGYAKKTYTGKTTREVFTKNKIHKDFDPKNINVRESRDSEDNPRSTPIIAALDVTGSMHNVIDAMARKGMNTLCKEIYDRKPVSDPHVMCMGVGDVAARDEAPLQVTQFEADIRISEQVNNIWLEGGGGGNRFESYHLPWYFAAMRTEIDSIEKRGEKGYLFTIGDEFPPDKLTAPDLKKVFGPGQYSTVSAEEALRMAQRKYHVFHVVVEEGNCARRYGDGVKNEWRELLGQNVLPLADHRKLAEVIVSTIQLVNGEDRNDIAGSWDGSTGLVVAEAIKDVHVFSNLAGESTGIVTL
jgi:hypothetical protein